MTAPLLHWPRGSGHCLCGAAFTEPRDHMRHARAFIPAWKKIRFKLGTDRATQITRTPGHEFTAARHPFVTSRWVLTCSCGNFGSTWAYPETVAALACKHIRDALRLAVMGEDT